MRRLFTKRVAAELFERIYQQWRIAQSENGSNKVDIIASRQYADQFHRLLKREAVQSSRFPMAIEWLSWRHMLGMDVRTYRAEDIRFPPAEVSIMIPDGNRYPEMFALMFYQLSGYFDFLTMKEMPWPDGPKERLYARKVPGK